MTDHNAQWHVDHFIKNSFFKERFKNSKVLEIQGGGVPLAAPLKTQYADNLILVGDAARHVNPITGGGIHTALSGGYIAGNFLGSFFQKDIPASAKNLKKYQDQWLESLGNKMWKLYDIKTEIFKTQDIAKRDQMLYETMSEYFSPDSEFKKI
jgi:digeranylgeranylglycerophospholipid reductase